MPPEPEVIIDLRVPEEDEDNEDDEDEFHHPGPCRDCNGDGKAIVMGFLGPLIVACTKCLGTGIA